MSEINFRSYFSLKATAPPDAAPLRAALRREMKAEKSLAFTAPHFLTRGAARRPMGPHLYGQFATQNLKNLLISVYMDMFTGILRSQNINTDFLWF